MNKKNRGKLIIIESGTDGSGKETQTNLIYKKLKEEKFKVKKITFPNYKSESSALIKMYLNGDFGENPNDVDGYVASTFFAVDRYASYKTEWEEFYNTGGIVISDRYTTSNMVHQSAKIETKKEIDKYLDWLYNFEYNIFRIPKPDLVIYLDVEPKVSEQLIDIRAEKKDIHEQDREYLEKSYKVSKYIAKKYGWKTIECTSNKMMRKKEDILSDIYDKITIEI